MQLNFGNFDSNSFQDKKFSYRTIMTNNRSIGLKKTLSLLGWSFLYHTCLPCIKTIITVRTVGPFIFQNVIISCIQLNHSGRYNGSKLPTSRCSKILNVIKTSIRKSEVYRAHFLQVVKRNHDKNVENFLRHFKHNFSLYCLGDWLILIKATNCDTFEQIRQMSSNLAHCGGHCREVSCIS